MMNFKFISIYYFNKDDGDDACDAFCILKQIAYLEKLVQFVGLKSFL